MDERTRLESVRGRKITVGSNPTLTAPYNSLTLVAGVNTLRICLQDHESARGERETIWQYFHPMAVRAS